MPILNIVMRVLFAVAMLITCLLSLATAYIVFAPDTFPKPFYLVYAYPDTGLDIPEGTVVIYQQFTTTTSNGVSNNSSNNSSVSENVNHGEYMPGEGIMYDTGAKVINLADQGGRRYIRINVVLEFAPNDATAYEEYLNSLNSGGTKQMRIPSESGPTTPDYVTQFTEELNTKKPVLDDIITSVVSLHTFDELYTSQGKEMLKSEILEQINSRMTGYKVIAVYFSEFVVE